jgi:hypothetical protein
MSGLVDIFLSCHPAGLAPLFVSLFLSDSEKTHNTDRFTPCFSQFAFVCFIYLYSLTHLGMARALILSGFFGRTITFSV